MKRFDAMAEKKNIDKTNYFVTVSLSYVACNIFNNGSHLGREVCSSAKDCGDCKLVLLKKSNQILMILALIYYAEACN